ncbi:MAG: Hint domain-containing protein [Pseudomonadota bacterium]
MTAGFRGAYVISWTQTDLDGLPCAPLEAVKAGASWAWTGEAVRVDGPNDVLQLDGAEGQGLLRKRAARSVRKLVGAALSEPQYASTLNPDDDDIPDASFLVTDGAQRFVASLVQTGGNRPPLLLFLNALPPKHTDLWIVSVSHALKPPQPKTTAESAMICFTPGTLIRTVGGDVPVELLAPGDLLLTKDDGPQPIEWKGQRYISGARLHAMPQLRPIRFRTGALLKNCPSPDLLVSPDHQMLLRGRAAQALFGEREVLAPAKSLVNDKSIVVDYTQREAIYLHLMLDRHAVVWANNVETETFHPQSADLHAMPRAEQTTLNQAMPGILDAPHTFGAMARRALSPAETAILLQDAA